MNNRNHYCFLDLDLDNSRKRLAACAAFVDSTDLTYGFSSKNPLALGGSELSRLKELISTDHEWASKDASCGGIITQPPPEGNVVVLWSSCTSLFDSFETSFLERKKIRRSKRMASNFFIFHCNFRQSHRRQTLLGRRSDGLREFFNPLFQWLVSYSVVRRKSTETETDTDRGLWEATHLSKLQGASSHPRLCFTRRRFCLGEWFGRRMRIQQ